MRVLALDSATGTCSVAVIEEGRVLARRSAVQERGQAAILLPLVESTLEEAGLGYGALDRLAVTVGPGSFTGLRIGMAAARGLALATRLPLVGVTCFEAVAHGLPPERRTGLPVLVVIDSRRAELFAQAFDAGLNPLGEPQMARPEALTVPAGPFLVAGDGQDALEAVLRGRDDARFAPEHRHPDAAVVARLALGRPIPERPPEPLYLRAPDVTLPGQPPP